MFTFCLRLGFPYIMIRWFYPALSWFAVTIRTILILRVLKKIWTTNVEEQGERFHQNRRYQGQQSKNMMEDNMWRLPWHTIESRTHVNVFTLKVIIIFNIFLFFYALSAIKSHFHTFVSTVISAFTSNFTKSSNKVPTDMQREFSASLDTAR